MPDPLRTRPRRAKGSLLPRLTGVAVVVAMAGGAAALVYTHAAPHGTPPHLVATTSPAGSGSGLSARVTGQQTVGLVDFGPYDDEDHTLNDPDDHPLRLAPGASGMQFVMIPRAEISAGTPDWTVDQMADGTDVFIYIPDALCLSAAAHGNGLILVKCAVNPSQRWRPVGQATVLGTAVSAFENAQTGGCITAPATPGQASLSSCGPARTRLQELAFWWTL